MAAAPVQQVPRGHSPGAPGPPPPRLGRAARGGSPGAAPTREGLPQTSARRLLLCVRTCASSPAPEAESRRRGRAFRGRAEAGYQRRERAETRVRPRWPESLPGHGAAAALQGGRRPGRVGAGGAAGPSGGPRRGRPGGALAGGPPLHLPGQAGAAAGPPRPVREDGAAGEAPGRPHQGGPGPPRPLRGPRPRPREAALQDPPEAHHHPPAQEDLSRTAENAGGGGCPGHQHGPTHPQHTERHAHGHRALRLQAGKQILGLQEPEAGGAGLDQPDVDWLLSQEETHLDLPCQSAASSLPPLRAWGGCQASHLCQGTSPEPILVPPRVQAGGLWRERNLLAGKPRRPVFSSTLSLSQQPSLCWGGGGASERTQTNTQLSYQDILL